MLRVSQLLLLMPLMVAASTASADAATIQITMENIEISPALVTARVGDTVEWINKDLVAHTATARNGDFDLTLPPKKTGTLVLEKAGMVEYYCRYHPNMKAALNIAP